MVDILVRNMEAAVAARLKQLAGERGTSMQQVARDILAEGTRVSREALIRRIRERAARLGPSTDESTDDIRAVRDGRLRG